jgi:hypothetical protein
MTSWNRPIRSLGPLLFLLCSSLSNAASLPLCEIDKSLYQKEIVPKILSGIPFEVMAVIFSEQNGPTRSDSNSSRRVLHISYNLWDEVITLNTNTEDRKTFPLAQGASKICRALTLETSVSTGVVRLLLNPMWSERITRLHLSVRSDLENKKLIGIDWKKIAEDMPSEKILFEREFP